MAIVTSAMPWSTTSIVLAGNRRLKIMPIVPPTKMAAIFTNVPVKIIYFVLLPTKIVQFFSWS